MTLDRQQIRRDAETASKLADLEHGEMVSVQAALATDLARHCLALLTELEQAELDRDHGQRLWEVERHDRQTAEARLANVPPLIEAARNVASLPSAVVNSGFHDDLRAALAAWETSTEPPHSTTNVEAIAEAARHLLAEIEHGGEPTDGSIALLEELVAAWENSQ